MSGREQVEKLLADHAALVSVVKTTCVDPIARAGAIMIKALEQGGTIFVAGNGGSAADSQHFAAELTGRFVIKTRKSLPGVALTVDTSALTAIANDFGYQQVFARQLEGLARTGDVFVGITTGGRSPNILAAMEKAYGLGVTCIGLVGADPSAVAPLCSEVVSIAHPETARVQEMHITVIHAWCQMIDRAFGGETGGP